MGLTNMVVLRARIKRNVVKSEFGAKGSIFSAWGKGVEFRVTCL